MNNRDEAEQFDDHIRDQGPMCIVSIRLLVAAHSEVRKLPVALRPVIVRRAQLLGAQ